MSDDTALSRILRRAQRLKRAGDLFIAIAGGLLVSPVCLALAMLIKLETPGPVLFVQRRMGKNEHLFDIYKFRSMRVNTIAPSELGWVKHNHALVTSVGHVMRRFKLDEIPQILNVIRGDMSFVGPRPTLPHQVTKMTPTERRRFAVPPGISGWAEVNGNVELDWREQLMLDVWYVDHWSLWLDMKILIKTIRVVIFDSRRNEDALHEARSHQDALAGQASSFRSA